ncbi:MAG: hypothetical protein M1308_21835 [Actinobacteria bacterium]|nr:hypothetical protein [Actinomycetota bacterium]
MKRNKVWFILGVIFGLAILALGIYFDRSILTSTGVGAVVASLAGWLRQSKGYPQQDERTLKLSGTAFRYSWTISALTVGALFLIDSLIPGQLTVKQILSILSVVILFIPAVLVMYFVKKGDAQ